MTTITVTMLQTRRGEDGTLWTAGNSYLASEAFARLLIVANLATGELPNAADDAAEAAAPAEFASQFATSQQLLQSRPVPIAATGQVCDKPCAVIGIKCILAGSGGGPLTLHDGLDATDSSKLKLSIPQASLVAGTYYPLVAADIASAMLMGIGAYLTNVTGGQFVVDVIDGSLIDGTVGAGVLCESKLMSASGVALAGPASIVSVRVLAAGSSGSFVPYDSTAAIAGREIHQAIAYNAPEWVTTQPIRIGPTFGAARPSNLFLTLPASGIVLVNHLPR